MTIYPGPPRLGSVYGRARWSPACPPGTAEVGARERAESEHNCDTHVIKEKIKAQNLELCMGEEIQWHCGCTASGKRNKQYTGLDPGYVMTIISYKNTLIFVLD